MFWGDLVESFRTPPRGLDTTIGSHGFAWVLKPHANHWLAWGLGSAPPPQAVMGTEIAQVVPGYH